MPRLLPREDSKVGNLSPFPSLAVQAIYVPADDLTDPAPATTFAHLDAFVVLKRSITEKGIYPAVDPLESTSRILDANIVGQDHYSVAQKVLDTCNATMTCRT